MANLICPGLRVYSKEGRKNFDRIFRRKIKVSVDRECTKEYCPEEVYLKENCKHAYKVDDMICCKLLY